MEALDCKTSWSVQDRDKIRKVLTMDYMSSEDEGEEDGNDFFVVRHLPWESERLASIKKVLDTKWERSRSKRSRRQSLPRVVGNPSNRPIPANVSEDCAWAINSVR